MFSPLGGRTHVVVCCSSECAEKMVFRAFDERRRSPKVRMRFQRSINSRGIVLSIKARLQLADPVPARGYGVIWVFLQILLKPALVEVRMIEGYKAWLLSPENPNKCQLRNDDVGDEAE